MGNTNEHSNFGIGNTYISAYPFASGVEFVAGAHCGQQLPKVLRCYEEEFPNNVLVAGMMVVTGDEDAAVAAAAE